MENRIAIQKLEETSEWLAELKAKLEENLQEAPEGALQSKICRGVQQFYVKKDGIRKYLRKSDWDLAKHIAQRDYHKKLLSQVCSNLAYLDTFLRKFDVDKLYDIYDELSTARQKLVEPFLMSDKQYIAEWEQIIYEGKDFEEGSQEIYTEQGERVRSKSEKIIADKLFLQNIPYHYERPIYLKGFGMVYPDFCCLDIRRRKEIIWEHFGMMGDSEYSRKALRKIDQYTQNRYYQGDNIIYTFESLDNPMNTKVVDKLIGNVFKK